ncbi:MAG: hypothetical protein K6B41_14120 [Butyrivibrio sp.]|nr:hypothetical protein [Butyrivibrio sp.]
MDFKFNDEKKQKAYDYISAEKKDQKTINKNMNDKANVFQQDWNEKTYEKHKEKIANDYHRLWKEKEKGIYGRTLEKMEDVKVEGALEGQFENQLHPGERFFRKTRNKENNKIMGWRKENGEACHYDKNTVREAAALDKYEKYHSTYFESRNHQKGLFNDYTHMNLSEQLAQGYKDNIRVQRNKYGAFFGTITGSLKSFKDTFMQRCFGEYEDRRKISAEDELNSAVRPFMVMTKKKFFFFKTQVGRLGTETKREKKDGSEYSKSIIRDYTTGDKEKRIAVMDELATKLVNFKLTPNMLTNKYLAKNTLQMQRYTDMLNAFVNMTNYNPYYLDVKAEHHTNPEMMALVRSRIILMAPIMSEFMEKHRYHFGLQKEKGILGKTKVIKNGNAQSDEEYNNYVKNTWEMIKQVYNSTADFMDDYADLKLGSSLKTIEDEATAKRAERKKYQKDENLDDSIFDIKYDVKGEKAKKLVEVRNKISSNPYIYEIFSGDMDQLFGRYHELTRRLDEIEARFQGVNNLLSTAGQEKFRNKDVPGVWKAYLEKEVLRMEGEQEIMKKQLLQYEVTIEYLVNQNVSDKNFKLTEMSEDVKTILKFEGLNHIFKVQEAYEYNNMFYQLTGIYDPKNFKDFVDKKTGKKVEINDLTTKYNFTMLKRGMERARLVNRLVDGKTVVNVNKVEDLNNIERRFVCNSKFEEASKIIDAIKKAKEEEKAKKSEAAKNNQEYKEVTEIDVNLGTEQVEGQEEPQQKIKKVKLTDISKYELTLNQIATLDINDITARYSINKELDVTKDETFEKYFQIKSIAAIGDILEKDYNGESIEGFNKLTDEQKDEVRIRAAMFKDYFKKWEGRMEYTRSEAYEYLEDVANMQGNNEIIEGVGKKFRLTTFENFNSDLVDKYWLGKEVSEQDKARANQMYNFINGMATANDYKAAQIKTFNKETYKAYKAKFEETKVRRSFEVTYTQDFNELVKSGIIKCKDDKELAEKKAEYLKRVDRGIELKGICDKYYKDHPYTEVNQLEKDLKDQLKKVDALDTTEAAKDKKKKTAKINYLKTIYSQYQNLMKKVDKDYCDEERIFDNLPEVLSDIKYASDFRKLMADNDGEYYHMLEEELELTSEQVADLNRYDNLFYALDNFVMISLLDYGITPSAKSASLVSRSQAKRNLVPLDPKYAAELALNKVKSNEFDRDEREKVKQENEAQKKLDEIMPLYLQEEEKERERIKNDEEIQKQLAEARATGKILIIKHNNKYEDEVNDLKSRIRSISSKWDAVQEWVHLRTGIYNEKVAKEEKLNKKDFILSWKDRMHDKLEKLSDYKVQAKSRNYVEELFKYLHKNFEDDIYTPEKMEKALADAGNAYFFQLSTGAKREAKLRLDKYKKDNTVMNDYLIWKGNKDTEVEMLERAKVFGRDTFMKNNITSIKKIMDVIGEVNASINDMQTPEFLDKLGNDLEPKGIDERQFMFLLRKHNVGLSGLSNTVKDTAVANENKRAVDMYLDARNKTEFITNVTEDVLKARKELDIKNVNEEYILKNFDKCYWIANKMIAFQQLYYGETMEFNMLKMDDKYRNMVKDVEMYFNKGEGEAYALYYNAVMAVAHKYGVTDSGMLSCGLSIEELEKLQAGQDAKEVKALKSKVKKNIQNAEKDLGTNIDNVKEAYDRNEKVLTIRKAMTNNLGGIEDPDNIDTYGIRFDDKKQIDDFNLFRKDMKKVSENSRKMIQRFNDEHNKTDKVTYANKTMYYYANMFFYLSEDESYEKADDKIKNIPTIENFNNMLLKDTKSVGSNLSVISEKKCNRVLDRLKKLGFGNGEIGKSATGEQIFNKEFFDKNFSEEFFVDMVNAMNLCILFEQEDDHLNMAKLESEIAQNANLEEVHSQEYEALSKAAEEMIKEYQEFEEKKKKATAQREEAERLQEEFDNKYGGPVNIPKEEMDKYLKTEKSIQNALAQENEFDAELSKRSEKIRDYNTQMNHVVATLSIDKNKSAGDLSQSKLKTIYSIKEFFENDDNRYLVSKYFDLFNAYLLSKDIQINGKVRERQVYDAVIDEMKQKNAGANTEALRVGEEIAKMSKEQNHQFFEATKNVFVKGEYKQNLKELHEQDAKLAKEKEKKEAEAKKRVDSLQALARRLEKADLSQDGKTIKKLGKNDIALLKSLQEMELTTYLSSHIYLNNDELVQNQNDVARDKAVTKAQNEVAKHAAEEAMKEQQKMASYDAILFKAKQALEMKEEAEIKDKQAKEDAKKLKAQQEADKKKKAEEEKQDKKRKAEQKKQEEELKKQHDKEEAVRKKKEADDAKAKEAELKRRTAAVNGAMAAMYKGKGISSLTDEQLAILAYQQFDGVVLTKDNQEKVEKSNKGDAKAKKLLENKQTMISRATDELDKRFVKALISKKDERGLKFDISDDNKAKELSTNIVNEKLKFYEINSIKKLVGFNVKELMEKYGIKKQNDAEALKKRIDFYYLPASRVKNDAEDKK